MDLLQNPFCILSATPRDNRQRLIELSQERSLLVDSNQCLQACSDLTNPRKRLSMEIAWLPGVGPKNATDALARLENSHADLLHIDGFTAAARANLLAAGLSRLTDTPPEQFADWILQLSWAFEDIDLEKLCVTINEERTASGFTEVTDLSTIEAEIQNRRSYYRDVIKSALDNLPPNELLKTITLAVDSATDKGENHGPIMIDDLIDTYEIEAQPFFEKEASNIRTLIEQVKWAADAGEPDSHITPMIDRLLAVLKNWETVAQPIQISAKSRGLGHAASQEVAELVRGLALYLFNQHDKIDLSRQLTGFLLVTFAAKDTSISERSLDDSNTLAEIAQQRLRAQEWRKEIAYEAAIGFLFKRKLGISHEGIDWRGRRWDLESITRIRWGGTRHYINGIPTGTIYNIFFGTNTDSCTIELRKEQIYNNFIDRLWKTVGVRLLTEHLSALRDGKQYRFGKALLTDTGMELERRKFFSKNERVFCRWGELVIWNGPGVFCIGKNGDKKLAASFSYQKEDNIHVLESIIRMFWKTGGERLSSLLTEQ